MKKYISFILILIFYTTGMAKPKILATASMWADMASVLGGTLIDVEVIVPIGSDPHLYEPTPNDIRKVNAADLILINGFTFEGWLQKLITSSGSKAKSIIITEGITPITNPQFKNSTDPHAWMDALHGIIYAENITKALIALDPLHDKEYQFNLDIYKKELQELNQYIQQKINTIPEQQRILITSHDAFHYFGNRYGLQVESLLGTSTEADVQTGDFIRVNHLIKEKKIPAIFIESTINPKLMEQMSKENNITIGGKLFADSLGDTTGPAGTYIQMLKNNANTIAEALSKSIQENVIPAKSDSNKILFYWIPGILTILLLIILILKRRK
ncbi:MAG: zinc ABC transporter substrate-binding protein [Saprospiraceae bacterium]